MLVLHSLTTLMVLAYFTASATTWQKQGILVQTSDFMADTIDRALSVVNTMGMLATYS